LSYKFIVKSLPNLSEGQGLRNAKHDDVTLMQCFDGNG
jgi:hypothetical protein